MIALTLKDNPAVSLVALTLAIVGTMSAIPVFWQMPGRFLGGGAAAGGVALINSIANLAGFGAPWMLGWIKTTTCSLSPDLAGKEADEGAMTRESVGEQASGGFDALTSREQAEVTMLNLAYRAGHGFPFITAVRRHTKDAILSEMRRRLRVDTDSERAVALEQIGWITRDRIAFLFEEPRPIDVDQETA